MLQCARPRAHSWTRPCERESSYRRECRARARGLGMIRGQSLGERIILHRFPGIWFYPCPRCANAASAGCSSCDIASRLCVTAYPCALEVGGPPLRLCVDWGLLAPGAELGARLHLHDGHMRTLDRVDIYRSLERPWHSSRDPSPPLGCSGASRGGRDGSHGHHAALRDELESPRHGKG